MSAVEGMIYIPCSVAATTASPKKMESSRDKRQLSSALVFRVSYTLNSESEGRYKGFSNRYAPRQQASGFQDTALTFTDGHTFKAVQIDFSVLIG